MDIAFVPVPIEMWKAGRDERLKLVAELLVANEALPKKTRRAGSMICLSPTLLIEAKGKLFMLHDLAALTGLAKSDFAHNLHS